MSILLAIQCSVLEVGFKMLETGQLISLPEYLLFFLLDCSLDTRKFIGVISVALTIALTYFCRAPWLWKNISPAIPIVFAYIFYICLSSFIHASAVDPGVCCIYSEFN